jgi:hypothetical protein
MNKDQLCQFKTQVFSVLISECLHLNKRTPPWLLETEQEWNTEWKGVDRRTRLEEERVQRPKDTMQQVNFTLISPEHRAVSEGVVSDERRA